MPPPSSNKKRPNSDTCVPGEQARVETQHQGPSKTRRIGSEGTIPLEDNFAPTREHVRVGHVIGPLPAATACGAGSASTESQRKVAHPSSAVLAQINRWLFMRCGAWSYVWKVLTPVMWGSADRLSVGCPQQQQDSNPVHPASRGRHNTTFSLPSTFDSTCDIVAFSAVQVDTYASSAASPNGVFHVSSAWPGRAVHVTINGAAVPSVAPGAAAALQTHAAIDLHIRSSKSSRRGHTGAQTRGWVAEASQQDVLNIARGCTPGQNTLTVHSASARSVAFRVYLCRSNWHMCGEPSQFLRHSSTVRLAQGVCNAAMQLAAGAHSIGSPGEFSIPPDASLAFRSACTAGQLSAVAALLEAGRQAVAKGAEVSDTTATGCGEEDSFQLETSSIIVSLLDPLSQACMQLPVRGVHCSHVACFDLGTWLEFARQRSSSMPQQCPVCNSVLHSSELVRDEALAYLIRATQAGVHSGNLHLSRIEQPSTQSSQLPVGHIEISSDGSWMAVSD